MPDFSQFIKFFNTALPAPTTNCTSVLVPGAGGAEGHTESLTHTRLADATWRLLVASDAAAKEGGGKGSSGGGGGGGSSNANAASGSAGGSAGGQASSGVLGALVPTITVGRMMVSTEDRWRIQAAMRREEVKSGQTRKEYNKKVTRAIKVTKGPSGDGFPAGRGRPV